MENYCDTLEKQIEVLSQKSNEKSVVIHFPSDNKTNKVMFAKQTCLGLLKLSENDDLLCENTHESFNRHNKKTTMVLKFKNEETASKIIGAAPKLKGTGIFVHRDQSLLHRKKRRALNDIKSKLLTLNPSAKIYLKGAKLQIDKFVFYYETIRGLQIKTSEEISFVKQTFGESALCFFDSNKHITHASPAPPGSQNITNHDGAGPSYNNFNHSTKERAAVCPISYKFNILCYNITGLKKKLLMPDFFKLISNYDIIILLETFVEEGNELQYLKYFDNFNVKFIPAIRNNMFGRARGGIFCGYKRNGPFSHICFKSRGNQIIIDILCASRHFQIVPIYLNFNDWNSDFEYLQDFLLNCNQENLMIIGDLNGRISNFQNSPLLSNGQFRYERNSSDINLNSNGKRLIEMFEDFGFFVLNGTTIADVRGNYTFISSQGCSTIDYCLVKGDWLNIVKDFEVYPTNFSNHLPIIVFCEYASQNPENFVEEANINNKLKWTESKALMYKQNLRQQMGSTNVQLSDSVEEATNTAFDVIRQSAGCRPSITSTWSNSKWYDDECRQSRKRSFSFLKLFRESDNDAFKQLYLQQNKRYKDLCNHKKQMYMRKVANNLLDCKDSKSFWYNVRILGGRERSLSSSIGVDQLAAYFEKLLLPHPNQNSISFAPQYISIPELDCSFMMSEMLTSLNKMKNNKASGADGIPIEFYKNATPAFLNYILDLLNKMFSEETFPSSFRLASISAVFKKGNPNQPENYRGISVLSSLRKLFAHILYIRLSRWVENNNIISCSQAGFRANLSTMDHIFALTSVARRFIEKKKSLYAVFVDFKAAFDTINRRSLLYKLGAIGVSTKFIRVYQELLLNMSATVCSGKSQSSPFRSETGVPQGCVLSPLMFALYINDIEHHLPGGVTFGDMHVKLLLYADDLVIFADDPVTLQLQINKLKTFCDLWDLKINSSKTKIMVFKSQTRSNITRNWTLDGATIEVVNEFKYLGFVISSNLGVRAHINEKMALAKSAINTMWSQFFSKGFVDPSSKFKVFNATVNSCFCYGNEVYGYQQMDESERIQRYFFKRVFRLPSNTPNYAIHVESGLPHIFIRNLKANADFLVKVMQRPDSNLHKRILKISLICGYTPFKNWQELALNHRIPFDLNVDNISDWKNIFYECISAVDEHLYQEDLKRARESSSRATYRTLNLSLGGNNYFREDFSVSDMSLIFKIRTETFELNSRPYRTDINPLCSLCNLNQSEDVVHFLAICPILQEIRRLYFNKSILTLEECAGILNGESGWKLLIGYITYANNYRKTYLNMSEI